MKFVLLLVQTVFLGSVVNSYYFSDDFRWKSFKKVHGKVYKSFEDEISHFATWKRNLKMVEEHNKKFDVGLTTYKMGINKFSDMNHEELGLFASSFPKRNYATLPWQAGVTLPDSIDWREMGAVTGVKNQREHGKCGSCYSFSSTGAIEGQLFRSSGQLIPLSEQQIMDCTGRGCNGGWMEDCFDYVEQAGGIESEDDYPYVGPNGGRCNFQESLAVATVGGYNVIDRDEEALQYAVVNEGPVSVAIFVVDSLLHYESGIYDERSCDASNCLGAHALLVVGYDTDADGNDYWIVKNSWVSIAGLDCWKNLNLFSRRDSTGAIKVT